MASQGHERISQLDGMRALAFLAVFAHHAVHAPLLWMGVDLFFVLSGFLITRNLLKLRAESTIGSSIKTFYFRRVLRIIPPYYAALTLILIFDPIPGRDAPWFYAFASNIHDTVYKPIQGSVNTFWSIAVEEQFYLVWPFLVLFAPRARLGLIFVAAIVIATAARAWLGDAIGFDAVYRLTLCRMDLLASGALLALVDVRDASWFERHRPRFVAIAGGAAAIFATLSLSDHTFRTSLNEPLFDVVGFGLSTVFFAMVMAFVRGSGNSVVGRVLDTPALSYVGKVSYMAYLVHVFAIWLVAKAHLGRWPTAGAALGLTIALSTVSWYGLEQPLQRLRKLVSPRDRADPGRAG